MVRDAFENPPSIPGCVAWHTHTHPTPPRRKRLCERAAACATAMRRRGRRASERRQRRAACGSSGYDALGGSTANRGRASSGGSVQRQIPCHLGTEHVTGSIFSEAVIGSFAVADSSVELGPFALRQDPGSRLDPVPQKIANKDLLCDPQKGLLRRRAAGRCERAAGSVVRQVVRWKLGGRALGAGRIGERAKIRLRRPKFRSSGPDCEMRATDAAFGRRSLGG